MKKYITLLLLFLPALIFAQILDSSNLPIIIIDTDGLAIIDEPKREASMGIIYNGPGQMNHITDPRNDYNGKIGIELRGSSSQFLYPKKQYALETRDETGGNNNVSLLGLPTENDWILHAPYGDKTLIRNALTYKLAGQIMEYAPRYKFCELILNDEYMGVYLLIEKIKRDNNRINISKLSDAPNTGDDLTGGYILKLDKFDGLGNDGFVSAYPPRQGGFQETFYQFHYPKPDRITSEQESYIENFISDFERNMASDDFADPINGYAQYIEVSTFIDYMLINEMSRNVDAYRISTFLYKDSDLVDGRLKLGPVWDFNLGYGNVDFCMGPGVTDWVLDYERYCPEDNWLPPVWWKKLRTDTTFRKQAKTRWLALRADLLSNENIMGCIDSLVADIAIAKDRNFQRWPIHGEYVWPNAFVGNNYASDLNYLKDWLVNRLAWMDQQIEDFDKPKYIGADAFEPFAFPNPFQNKINFEYYVHELDDVTILIFNAQGQVISTLQDYQHPNGKGRLIWENNDPANGFYFYNIYFNNSMIKSGLIFCNK